MKFSLQRVKLIQKHLLRAVLRH